MRRLALLLVAVVALTGCGGDGDKATREGCQFWFKVDNVPPATFYRVEVGRRGEISYSLGQLKQASWSVELPLGS
jgi:hypothetical protein